LVITEPYQPWKYAAKKMKNAAREAGLGGNWLAYVPAQLFLDAP
jgi:hypothetical protein